MIVDNKNDESAITSMDLATYVRDVPSAALIGLRVIRDLAGAGYLQEGDCTTVTRLDSPQAPIVLLRHAVKAGYLLRPLEVREAMDCLRAFVPLTPFVLPVWNRVAALENGVAIDRGDDSHVRFVVTPGRVQVVGPESPSLFWRPPILRPFVMPSDEGNFDLLDDYLNVDPYGRVLLKGWVTFVLGHAKLPTQAFPMVAIGGDQGAGKSVVCRILQELVDPSSVGGRSAPQSIRDLGIAAKDSHLIMFDNVRALRPDIADALCICATGGSVVARRLYTDSEIVAHQLHVAVILNGIHEFIEQPDLAQRCVPIRMLPLEAGRRESERDLFTRFRTDLPVILKGMLDYMAKVMAELPGVRPTDPERLIDFSHWLAAMEKVDGASEAEYQAAYSAALNEGMRNSLLEHPVAAAVVELVESRSSDWIGTPTNLLEVLDRTVGRRASHAPDWPRNPIALSRQLRSLSAGLRRQGIEVRLGRSRERKITIARVEGVSHD